MTRSRLTEQKEKSGVILKVGTTEIACDDQNQALEEFRQMDADQGEIVSVDGNHCTVKRG